MNSTSPPATWNVADVTAWATQAKLAPDVVSSLANNQVDGPTLVTLTKAELQSELGIISLPARRYLWELIRSLNFEQIPLLSMFMSKKFNHCLSLMTL